MNSAVREYLPLLFIALTAAAIAVFAGASRRPVPWVMGLAAWATLVGLLAMTGFFSVLHAVGGPPRAALLIGPALVGLLLFFSLPAGRRAVQRFDLKTLHALHILRIPVEAGLAGLFAAGLIPAEMTFYGRNLDILAGITAVGVVAWMYWGKPPRAALIVWNILALGLVLNIALTGLMSVPGPMQRVGFEQPNVAVLRFPYCWLPALIVPLVLAAHGVALVQLVTGATMRNQRASRL